MKIYKYEIQVEPIFELALPLNAEILCVQTQRRKPVIWVSFEEVLPQKMELRKFAIFPTGKELGGQNKILKYIGTFQIEFEEIEEIFVGHLYECPSQKLINL